MAFQHGNPNKDLRQKPTFWPANAPNKVPEMKMLTLQGQRLAGLLPAFGRAESGIAATEFALILPMFMAFTMTGIELVNRTLAQMQLNYIAASVADNAGRVRVGIDELDIEEVMIGARESGSRIKRSEERRVGKECW